MMSPSRRNPAITAAEHPCHANLTFPYPPIAVKRISLISGLLLAVPALWAAPKSKAPQTLPGGWKYAWGDEFNGNKLNTKKWKCELGPVRNKGASHSYVPEAVTVKNGKLIITSAAKKTPNPAYEEGSPAWPKSMKEQPYMSGSVTTRDIKHFTAPGRLEFRAKVPKAKGVWPAIWTMHVNKYGWPANGEIDILEHISQEPNRVYSIFRWGRGGGNQEQKVIRTTTIENYSKSFHTYALQWDEEEMFIEIDGKEVGRIKMSEAQYPNGDNPLLTPCYLIINTAIGGPGTWPEQPDPKQYPVKFELDYVRYYTKGDGKGAAENNAK